MPGLLVSHQFNARYGTDFVAAGKRNSVDIELLVLPPDPEARIAEAAAARAEIAYFSSDIIPLHTKQFFSATRKSPALKWMQVFNAGVDHPVFASVLERGVRLTTSSGTAAEPIAQTAIAGMLILARNFPRWFASQREHRWDPMPPADFPRDLRGQTMLVYGLGAIGVEIAACAPARAQDHRRAAQSGARRARRRNAYPRAARRTPAALRLAHDRVPADR